jgi:crotonobetainyl-CoA:carnitine CoA-transferase CaiB-like acyl-CoA transferase
VAEIDQPRFGRLARCGPPVSLSATSMVVAPGCLFAQHTEAILRELGYDDDVIAELLHPKVVTAGR